MRVAANKAAQSLTRVSIKMCDGSTSTSKSGEKAIQVRIFVYRPHLKYETQIAFFHRVRNPKRGVTVIYVIFFLFKKNPGN